MTLISITLTQRLSCFCSKSWRCLATACAPTDAIDTQLESRLLKYTSSRLSAHTPGMELRPLMMLQMTMALFMTAIPMVTAMVAMGNCFSLVRRPLALHNRIVFSVLIVLQVDQLKISQTNCITDYASIQFLRCRCVRFSRRCRC